MPYQHLILLAPCHGLEDFPLYHKGDDAASMIACWTALWHPALIHGAGQLPRIERCDYPPQDIENALLLLPTPCEAELDSSLADRVTQQNATLLRGLHKRSEILQQAFASWDEPPQLDTELVRDFLAFGFAFLQVELLTQQMRYASSIDHSRVQSAMLKAAQATIEHDHETCREQLTSCFDALSDERQHYYPVDVYLLDLTLLAATDTTLDTALQQQLNDPVPQNFLASGKTIAHLSEHHAASQAALRSALADGRVGLAGGEYDELELPLMTYDSARRQFLRGFASYQQHLGQTPHAFGRRRCGIYRGLSQLIEQSTLQGALHLKFDEGRYPEPSQCKAHWEAGSDRSVATYGRQPLDAALHETFLNLPSQLSESMDMDHVATRMFIHWPGHVAPWYHDLRRAARYGDALGKFVTLQEYFGESVDSGVNDTFAFDDYKYPYLKQAVDRNLPDPISRWSRYWHQSVRSLMSSGIRELATCVNDTLQLNASEKSPDSDVLDQLDERTADDSCDPQVAVDDTKYVVGLQASLTTPDATAMTVLNPCSFVRRVLVDTTELGRSCSGDAVYASEREPDDRTRTLVDVPAMGFASIVGGADSATLPGPKLGEQLTLRNEFLQATIDPDTGALRALRDYHSRTTRLSQQLALRIATPKTGPPWLDRQNPATYSVMAADSVELTQNGKIRAEITARGRLLDESGTTLGEFTQRYELLRGSRILQLEIELTPVMELLPDPWDSYYACRFAWKDETALIRSGIRMQTFDTSRKRFEAPLFVDIDTGKQHTTIFTGGIPYHRRLADNRLDTPLIVSGEQQRVFRIGLGVDVPYMTRSALDFMASVPERLPGRAKTSSGWLFHLDAKNVVATSWESNHDGEQKELRVCLVETEGRPAHVHLRGFRPFSSAAVVNFLGDEIRTCELDAGVVGLRMQAYEFAEVRVIW